MTDNELRALIATWGRSVPTSVDAIGKRGRDRLARQLIPQLAEELLAAREEAAKWRANYEAVVGNKELADRLVKS